MLLNPLHWLVWLVTWLPDLLRPGAFIGLILLILWFVFVQRGLPALWHATCRGTARLLDGLVGLVLLPEYLITSARQKQSEPPAQGALVISEVAEGFLEAVGGLYQRHLREPMRRKRPPWILLAIIVGVITAPWAVMELASPKSAVSQELSRAYDVWRDVEGFAGIDPDRRADAGVSWPPRPQELSTHRRGRHVSIALRCRRTERCRGRLILRNGKGVSLHSRKVAVGPGRTVRVQMELSRQDAKSHHVLSRIARAEPE